MTDLTKEVNTLVDLLDDPYWVNRLHDKWQREYIYYEGGKELYGAVQMFRTPPELCREMIDKLREFVNLKGKIVLTLNVEFIPFLRGAKEIWFFSDNKEKAIFVEQFYPRVKTVQGNFLEWENNMKFDVVCMNPPYQQEDGGHSRSAKPIYHKFIEKAIDDLQPDFLVSINPSRWMVGGKGLDKFRQRMIIDRRVKTITDDMTPSGIFKIVDIAGGVNYFIWDRNYNGKCCFNGVDRFLDEEDIVLRENESRFILRKVKNIAADWVATGASPRRPYGLEGDAPVATKGVTCWFKQSIGLAKVDPKVVKNPRNDIHLWRVLVPRAPIAGQTDFSKPISFFNDRNVIIAKPGEYCTETYIVLKALKTEKEANNFVSYIKTRFFRFMLRMRVISQDITREKYAWVPDLKDYSKPWTDEELYEMFHLTRHERAYIESKIKELK